jgi:double-stranded uracil-DNA glycosylase
MSPEGSTPSPLRQKTRAAISSRKSAELVAIRLLSDGAPSLGSARALERLYLAARGCAISGRMGNLRDILTANPSVLFVGINPSLRSAAVGHHFAGPGNPFWRLLHAARIVPQPLSCEEGGRLAEFELALTNLCPRPTRAAAELTRAELERGRRVLARKIRRLHPRVVAFVGVGIYRDFFGRSASAGAGAKPETIFGARVFVLPNPSGLNAAFPGFRDKLVWFERLREFVES